MSSRELHAALAGTTALLLDFDGPVTALMAHGRGQKIANHMREVAADLGIAFPDSIKDATDPLVLFRGFPSIEDPRARQAIEQAMIAGEIAAAKRAAPTDGVHALIRACQDTDRAVVIVSNNSREAIETFLTVQGIHGIRAVCARVPGEPALLKPDPHLVERGAQLAAGRRATVVLFGDSVTDIQAARAAGVRSVVYGKNPQRFGELESAGADAMVGVISELVAALQASPRLPQQPRQVDENE